jgi:dihydrofolate synthase/folylpolyglutamate synthase
MGQLHPKVMDLSLGRMHRLLDTLGNPERKLPPVIHIAGTNGKGSTQAMIRAGLEAAGHKVHAYTSPHLARFHERIRLAGELISEDALVAVLEETMAVNAGEPITYFEITTCAAMLAMSRIEADYTLLEVGLGGRLDTTNVVETPRLTIITPISLDHQSYLGETLPEIAAEKAGILKRGVPCIVSPQPDDVRDVIEAKAEAVQARCLIAGQDWHSFEERGGMVYQDEMGLLDLPLPALIGAHQVENAGAALCALRILGVDSYEAALLQAEWPARMQKLKFGPLLAAAPQAELWLDGGHNPAAGKALAEALTRLPERPLYMVCGMLNTKDIGGYLAPLAASALRLTGVSIPGETATLSAREICTAAQAEGMVADTADSVAEAVARIANEAPTARILLCGSLYLAGRILRENG